MTERKATYARFRSTVLQARAVLERPCGTESRGSACETLPAGTDQSYLTGGEAAVLSRLLILSALKIMQTSGALGALASDAPGSRAVNRLDRECRAADLPHRHSGSTIGCAAFVRRTFSMFYRRPPLPTARSWRQPGPA